MPLQIQMSYINAFPADAVQAIDRAAATWMQTLTSTQTVRINAYWNISLSDLVAMCVPNGFENFANAPHANTWYTGALADKLSGQDQDPGNPDMVIFFNSAPDWFNTDPARCPNDKFDLETTALHEMGHGLGFVGLFWVATEEKPQIGSYGSPDVLGSIRGSWPRAFALPNLNWHPSAFGRLVHDGNGRLLTDYPEKSKDLAEAIQSKDLAITLPGGEKAIYAPPRFEKYSSGDHFEEDSLMVPFIAKGKRIHTVDRPVLEVMVQMGW